jgi:hypothetical protein
LLEIKLVMVHFQGKAFNPSHLFACISACGCWWRGNWDGT